MYWVKLDLIKLLKLNYVKIAYDRCVCIFTLEYIYEGWELRYQLLYIYIFIIIVRRSVYIPNC